MKGRRSSYTCSYNHHYNHNHNNNGESNHQLVAEMKKGPWKAEEDEVLLNHVKKYGPRDWSSIQSKGLLQRSGKSCRLRWVNKLRPNLKNGVKFSVEEERIVIDLQGQFGNKWAKIATYLPGRTDNDVKNFWSSRRKRLARILHNNKSPEKNSVAVEEAPTFHHVSPLEGHKLSSSSIEDEQETMSLCKPQSCSSSSNVGKSEETRSMVPAMPLPEPVSIPNPFIFDPADYLFHSQLFPAFPQFPQLLDIPMPTIESQDGFDNVGPLWDPNFLDNNNVFGSNDITACDASDLGNSMHLPFSGNASEGSSRGQEDGVKKETGTLSPDSFIDDFPIDMFDYIEPLPSPSDW